MKAGLANFSYSEAELGAIAVAMASPRPWDCEEAEAIKTRIKAFHLQFGEELCCYCYRDVHGEFSMVLDVEHILPKRHYKPLTFDIRNLSVACKRCNMKMKRDDLDFLRLPVDAADIWDGQKYRLIHPNIDERNAHLERVVLQRNAKKFVKYVVIGDSEKGKFSYDYFRLKEFEVDSFDTAQGANQAPAAELDAIANIRALVKEIEGATE